MATSPNYAATPTVGAAMLTTGDTSRTAPSNVGTIFTPGSLGGSVERIVIQPVATTTASTVRIFRYDGSAYHLYAEVALPALTATGSAPVPNQTLEAVDTPNLMPIAIPANWSLRATVNDTQTGVQIQAEGGSY
ncbi:hypothetical protein [Roseiterribacter gracilis]|uniref:Uncharacterized protein n=1 Tax=Roseiterribacter gracilis TaxID=2812848 RepID=A0A8S8XFJ3_9PROT|nr:hypothetical protein TMPK1_36510 [Rhodospirillales bacterium TMPK1]